MPHSFPITVVANPTKLSIKPPPMICDIESTKDMTRFPVPTPPLSSASPIVELAPIIYLNDSIERPPSPESPKAKRFVIHELVDKAQKDSRPSPLEPLPHFNEQKPMFPLSLFELLPPTHACITPNAIQIPIPRRSSPPLSRYEYQDPFFKAIQSSPMSPTMAAASASAAASAAHRHPGSQVASSLLKSIQSENKPETTLAFSDCYSKKTSKRGNVDQSMFLTKNDHIKRPRNAWIHFRCHYGQALKIQDPTLRAEEISKRASQRWSKLSENEKKPWHGLAEQEKLAHREAFPEYRYCPRRAAPSSPPAAIKRPIKDTPLELHDDCSQKRLKRKASNK